jgi:hypothetical protein
MNKDLLHSRKQWRGSVTAVEIVLSLLTGLSLFAAVEVAEPQGKVAVNEPKALLGEWVGEMTATAADGPSNKLYLTLKSVAADGGLSGVAYVVNSSGGTGRVYSNRDQPITAFLEDDKLTFTIPNGPQFWLTVSGSTLSGSFRGIRLNGEASLRRVK